MDGLTPETVRVELARRHQAVQAQTERRSAREQVRLKLLRWRGRRYGHETSTVQARPSRILVVRPDHLGDLLFATPALHLLRTRFPQAHIAALVGPWGEAVLAGTSDVDQVLTLPFPGFTRAPKGRLDAPYTLLRSEARRLATSQFDLALILRFDHWWGAWLAAAAGIARRVGYAVDEVTPFLTQPVPYVAGRHEVVQNLGLVFVAAGIDANHLTGDTPPADAGWALRYAISAADLAAADRLLPQTSGGRRMVAFHPGSGAAVKRWRIEAWAELALRLSVEQDVQVVFTGSAGEAALIEPVLAAMRATPLAAPPISLAGQTGLGALAAVYRRCAVVIGPDSGPLHLAVAVATPTVHLYGPVDRRTFGPWGSPQRHRVVTSSWACIPCNRLDWPDSSLAEHGCVRDVSVEQVLAQAIDLLRAQQSVDRSGFPQPDRSEA